MRNLRSTAWLLILFSAGLGALWWADYASVPTARQSRELNQRVLPGLARFKPSEIRGLEIDRPGQARLVLRRRPEGGWRISEPLDALADPLLIENIARSLIDLRKSPDAGTIEGAPESFGLGSGAVVVRVLGEAADPPLATLRVGRSIKDRSYVRSMEDPESGIEVADSRSLSVLTKPAAEWRDQMLFRMPSFRVSSLTIAEGEPQRVVELSRNNRNWRMLRPIRTLADDDKAEGLVAELSALRVADGTAGFVKDDVKDLAPFGLDRPWMTLTLTPYADSGKPQVVRIGAAVPDKIDERYALIEGQDDVVRVDVKMLRETYRDPNSLRNRKVADIVANRIRRLRIGMKDQDFDLWRTPAGWIQGESSKTPVDSIVVQTLVTALTNLETSEFFRPEDVPRAGLDTPSMRIRAWDAPSSRSNTSGTEPASMSEDAPDFDLTLGRHDALRKTVYGRLEGDASVLAFPDLILESLPKDQFAFRERTVLTLNPSQVESITIERPGASLTVTAPGSGVAATSWKLTAPVPGPADEQAVTTLLVTLSSLRADQWISDSMPDPAVYGLNQPGLRIQCNLKSTEKGSKAGPKLRLGKYRPGTQTVYANIEGDSRVFTIAQSDVTTLNAELRDSTIFQFAPEKIARVVLSWPTRTIAFLRDPSPGAPPRPWKVESGYDPSGFDLAQLEELLRSLSKLRTTRFLQYDGSFDPGYGLTPPRLRIELTRGPGEAPLLLRVGSAFSTTLSVATAAAGNEGPVFGLTTSEEWNRLLVVPPRLGDLPADVFSPVTIPPE